MDVRATINVASASMLVAVTASLGASVGYVVLQFDDLPPSAMVIGDQDEFFDRWVAVHRDSDDPLLWKASHLGVRYAVDDPATASSPGLDTVATEMPLGRAYSFCAAGGEELAGWSFMILVEDRLVSVVSFAVIMPCEG